MSQHEQVPEPPRGAESTEPREASRSEPEGELSFDDLPLAGKGRADQTPFVHTLQKRAGSALDAAAPDEAAEAAPDDVTEADFETIERWSPRVQLLCIMGGSALCWAVIVAPFLLF